VSDNDNIIPIPPQFAALGITEGESVVIPRAQHEALMAAAKDLSIAADTAELVLQKTHPAMAQSLRKKVTAMRDALSGPH